MFQEFYVCFYAHTNIKLLITLSFQSRPGIQGLLVWHVIPSWFQVLCFVFLHTHKNKLFITLPLHSRPGIQGLLVWHVIPSWFQVLCFVFLHTQKQTVHHSAITFKTWYPGLVGLACHPFMFQVACFFGTHPNTNCSSLCHSIQDLVSRACWFGMSSLHVSGGLFFWHTPKHKLFITLSFLIHTCMHTYIHTYRQTCMHAWIHTYILCNWSGGAEIKSPPQAFHGGHLLHLM